MMTKVKTTQEIAAMRVSGQMLASVLRLLQKHVAPGVSTEYLATVAKTELQALGGKPAFLGYEGFPDVLCVSVNDEVVHGIPKADKLLAEGDIVSLDFGVNYQGMITDAAVTYPVGVISPAARALVEHTKESLDAGLQTLKSGVQVGDIGAAVQQVLDRYKHGIVRELVGHGVGHELHEDPHIPNYGQAGQGVSLSSGMTIAIEPMATMGTAGVYVASDGWTFKTRDGSLSAHFEHTVLVTDNGFEVLTKA